MEIKIGFIVAYDYELLRHSLPPVYKDAHKIVLAIDKNRRTFKGETFTIEPSFFSWLRSMDPENKIVLYEDEFYVPDIPARALETRKRNMLAKFMGDGGWHVQLDVDEYFVDFVSFVNELHASEKKFKNRRVTIRLNWYTIYKRTSEGFFLIDGKRENFAVATNYPVYEATRYNGSNENFVWNHVVLHQSFGRSEADLEKKFRNWSHTNDFDTEAYFEFWKSVNVYNYRYVYDFNPVYSGSWMRLKFVAADSIDDLLAKTPCQFETPKHMRMTKFKKWLPPVIYERLIKV